MAASTKIMPKAHIFYSQAGRSVSGKTVLKTEGIIFPNTDQPRLVNQSGFGISGFVTKPSDIKYTVISRT